MDMAIPARRIGTLPLSPEELQLVERAAHRSGVQWERFFVTAGIEKAARLLTVDQPATVAAFMPVI
jgi:uncharacterized protein (DUF1778 family)